MNFLWENSSVGQDNNSYSWFSNLCLYGRIFVHQQKKYCHKMCNPEKNELPEITLIVVDFSIVWGSVISWISRSNFNIFFSFFPYATHDRSLYCLVCIRFILRNVSVEFNLCVIFSMYFSPSYSLIERYSYVPTSLVVSPFLL